MSTIGQIEIITKIMLINIFTLGDPSIVGGLKYGVLLLTNAK